MLVRNLSDVSRTDLASAGGKGASLGDMIRAGFPVPPGFVVTAGAYAEQAQSWGLAERVGLHLTANNWEAAAAEAATLFRDGAMLPALEASIRHAYHKLGGGRVAVRSSATAEDLADASFAGQQETFLDIEGEDAVIAAVRECWASLYSPRALHYRHVRKIDHLEVAIAVVVQEMVPADAAGVLFTVDPVKHRSDRMLLSAAPGLGEAVVSGHRRGDTYRIRREPYTGAGRPETSPATIVDRDLETPGSPALSDATILDLCRFGLSLEAHFGCPQDIEYAALGGRVHLLQSRPITTLGAAEIEPIEPAGELDFFQRNFLKTSGDRFPIAPKPLDQWFMRGATLGIQHMMGYLGFDVIKPEEPAGGAPLWRDPAFLGPKVRPTPRLLGVPARVARGLRGDWMDWWKGEPLERARAMSAPVDVTELSDSDLLRRADATSEGFGKLLGDRFEPMIGLMGTGLVELMTRLAVGKERSPAVVGDLLGGIHTYTADTNRALFALGQRAKAAGEEVASAIKEGRIEDLRKTEQGRSYLGAFNAFLDEHGHRESTALTLSTPTWKHDPEIVWALIRGFMEVPDLDEDGSSRRAQAALDEVDRTFNRVPGLSAAFRSLLDRTRAILMYRENTHFDLARVVDHMQSLVREISRRFKERGVITSDEDIFYLSESEVKAWLVGSPPPPAEVEKLLKRRRATYQVVNGMWQKRRVSESGTGNELRGVGASAGVVRAKARIVRSEHQFDRLKPGEVLVCSYTNPSWTPLFSYAAAVVTDTGGPASHAAIVAREYGIPAVMGVGGATERIADGQEILVDGTEGRVVLT